MVYSKQFLILKKNFVSERSGVRSRLRPSHFRRRSDVTLNRGLVCVRMLNIKTWTLIILTFTA